MKEYVGHITEHLWKENNRLFLMAEARLQHAAEGVDRELGEVEEAKLGELGRTRKDYEDLADALARDVSRHAS